MFVVNCKGSLEWGQWLPLFSHLQIIKGKFKALSTGHTHSPLWSDGLSPWDFCICLCYSCVSMLVRMPVLCFLLPQWVCVLADGNWWDRQPGGRSSPGSSSAGERHHPPWLVLTIFFSCSDLLYHPLLLHIWHQIYDSLMYFVLHGVEHANAFHCLT